MEGVLHYTKIENVRNVTLDLTSKYKDYYTGQK